MMIKVDDKFILRPVSLASAEVIFESIQSSKAYLKEWLPFVDSTKSVVDTKKFIKFVE